VLDGFRAATDEERVAGVISRCHIGSYRHSMPRGYAGSAAVVEDEADLIALNVLAPLPEAACTIRGLRHDLDTRTSAIAEHFGLPLWAARMRAGHAGALVDRPRLKLIKSIQHAATRPDSGSRGR
jgi:hypothetical protein